MKKKRIFEIAKELNISHIEIMDFLKKEKISVKTIMASVDESVYFKILGEFSKEKDIVERIHREKARKEAEDKRKFEEEALVKAEKEQSELVEEVQNASGNFIGSAVDYILDFGRTVNIIKKVKKVEVPKEIIKKKPDEVTVKKTKPIISKKSETKPDHKFTKKDTKKVDDEKTTHHHSKKTKLKRIAISEIEEKLGHKSSGPGKKKKVKKKKTRQVDVQKVEETLRKTMAQIDTKSTKKKYKKRIQQVDGEETDVNILKISEFATVEDLAKNMNISASEVISKCISLGMFVTINQRLDFDTITLIADEFEFEVEQMKQYGEELLKIDDSEEDIENAKPRPPIVAIMGHVDHGKTTLLDYIRKENVVAGESGGITQHIGAYQVELNSKQKITFLDTPGHEAFTAMRARGAQVTDIVVLIVAADDGVMPRTIEAINHAKAAEVPIIVAINKIDKPAADIERVKRELSEHGILVESWGGDIQTAEVSALTGQGVPQLLDLLLLESEMLELKANPDTFARGTVIEARIDKLRGPIATILIQKGKLKIGDPFVCGAAFGRIRAMYNERDKKVFEVGPSDPIRIVGFDIVPGLADVFAGVKNEKEARKIASERQKIQREQQYRQQDAVFSLDTISAQIAQGQMRNLNVILKGDVDGSIEAVAESLGKLGNKEVSVSIIHKATGQITANDVLLAKTSNGIVLGFNVVANPKIKELAKQEHVELRRYRVIYELLDDIKSALEGMLTPDKIEEELGQVEIRAVIKIPNVGSIAGSYVTNGIIHRNAIGRLKRDGEIIHTGEIISLKRFKEDVKTVKEGFECGLNLEGYNDYLEGDIIEAFEYKSVKRKLI